MAETKKKKLGPGRHLTTIKRHRQDEKKKQANKGAISEVRSAIKKLRLAVTNQDRKQAEALFVQTQSIIDRAIKKGLLHAQQGRRKISRLHRSISALSS